MILSPDDDFETAEEFAQVDLAEEIKSCGLLCGFGPDGPSAAKNNPSRETFAYTANNAPRRPQ